MTMTAFIHAVELFESGDFDGALLQFAALCRESVDPKEQAGFLLDQANCYMQLERPDDAERCLNEARELSGSDQCGRLIVGLSHACLLLEQDCFAEALEALNVLLEESELVLDKPEFLALRRDVQLQRVFVYIQLNRYREALPDLEAICSAQPDGEALHFLARCYYELKQYLAAEAAFTLAVEHGIPDEQRASFHYHRGRNYYELGEFAKAKQEFVLSAGEATSMPPRSQVYEMLAATCRLLGGHEDAARYAAMGAA
jgi:tetratricopeptide (TPR) repeat protein